MPGEAVTVKGDSGDKRTWEEIIRKASQKYYLARKTMFANSLGKKTLTFSPPSLLFEFRQKSFKAVHKT